MKLLLFIFPTLFLRLIIATNGLSHTLSNLSHFLLLLACEIFNICLVRLVDSAELRITSRGKESFHLRT